MKTDKTNDQDNNKFDFQVNHRQLIIDISVNYAKQVLSENITTVNIKKTFTLKDELKSSISGFPLYATPCQPAGDQPSHHRQQPARGVRRSQVSQKNEIQSEFKINILFIEQSNSLLRIRFISRVMIIKKPIQVENSSHFLEETVTGLSSFEHLTVIFWVHENVFFDCLLHSFSNCLLEFTTKNK